ncbi:MAG TPA: protein-L-isoaspartate(D-aspartate) O-methyltransferase [Cytophagaceae bacterium]|jgi:protein-L-isoaspartate(D-aspartate) O-methyltransferase|nr:protein-L-isoaspartate(D-aspartate) O-methyltransferase [Cytophagaceae bacterium]
MKFEDGYREQGMRKQLVRKLKEKGITDAKVLEAIGAVPRHVFLDKAFLEQAYQDKAFPIGEGQTISQPYTVAFQTQLLEVAKDMKVLEIGTGSGYQACVLSYLKVKLYTIEYNKALYTKTSNFLRSVGLDNIQFFFGDGSQGLPTFAPYDRIIVTAGAPAIPDKLIHQLVIGGKLVIPVGDDQTQTMLRITRLSEEQFQKEEFGAFKFVPLLGKDGW